MDLSHNALDVHQPLHHHYGHHPYPIHDYPPQHHHHLLPLLNASAPPLTVATTSDQQQQQQPPTSPPSAARPLTTHEEDMLAHLDRLKFFLATAPSRWAASSASASSDPHFSHHGSQDPSAPPVPHPALNRFLLPSGEYVSCVLWNGLYHITGTDIVRALVFRFDAFGRPVRNMKKFEEGVFSDLRNLKPGTDACLEEPKSPFLDLLFKYQCIRTQKKQKVFYWFSVPHDRLFLDALERDLKREKMGSEATTQIVGEPARSFTYDPKRSLFEQFSKARGGIEGEGELERAVREIGEVGSVVLPDGSVATSVEELASSSAGNATKRRPIQDNTDPAASPPDNATNEDQRHTVTADDASGSRPPAERAAARKPGFTMLDIFDGSPGYKQRRKKGSAAPPVASGGRLPPSSKAVQPPTSALATADVIVGLPAATSSSLSVVKDYESGYGSDYGAATSSYHYAEDDYAPVPIQSSPYGSSTAYPMPTSQNNVGLGLDYHQQQSRHSSPFVAAPQPMHRLHPAPSLHQMHQMSPSPAPMHHDQLLQQHHHLPPMSTMSPVPPAYSSPAPQHFANSPVPDSNPFLEGLHHPSAAVLTPAHLSSSLPNSSNNAGDKPKSFQCYLLSCSRTFKRMEHLKRHMRTHTMEKPYECEKCGKKFSRSDNLTQHLRTHGRDAGGDDKSGVNGGGSPEEGEGGSAEDEESSDGMVGLGDLDLDQERREEDPMGVPMAVFGASSHFEGSPAPYGTDAIRPGSSYGDHHGPPHQHQWPPQQPDFNQPPHSQSLPVTLADAAYPGLEGSPVPSHHQFTGSPQQAFDSLGAAASHLPPLENHARHLLSRGGVGRPRPPLHAATTDSYTRGVSLQPLQGGGGYRRMHSHHDLGHMYNEGLASSAPSHKLGYENLAGAPPMFASSSFQGVGPIRRHRSATPTIRQQQQMQQFGSPGSSIPSSSSSSLFALRSTSISVSNNGAERSHGYHPYASRSRDFSGPSSLSQDEYTHNGLANSNDFAYASPAALAEGGLYGLSDSTDTGVLAGMDASGLMVGGGGVDDATSSPPSTRFLDQHQIGV